MCISKLFIFCVFSVSGTSCTAYFFLFFQMQWITLVACWSALILVITRNCDAKPCNFICGDHFLYERCCEMQFLPDPFLSVSIFFSFSPSPAWSWAGGMSVMHTLAGRMHSCRAQHPVPFVSTSSTSLKLCGTYAAPGFTPPSSFIPFLWASSIFQNLPLLQSEKCYFSQPTTLPNHEPSAHDDAQVPLHLN